MRGCKNTAEKALNKFDGNNTPDGKTFTAAGADNTYLKGTALGRHGDMPACIDIKNGKVVRIRPFHYDWKYDREKLNPWKMEARGKTWEPTWKVGIALFSLAYKKGVYSPNRIKYPLKRVDWDPNGENGEECVLRPLTENPRNMVELVL